MYSAVTWCEQSGSRIDDLEIYLLSFHFKKENKPISFNNES